MHGKTACVVRDANTGHHLAGWNSSWCPELEVWTTHHDRHRTEHQRRGTALLPAVDLCVPPETQSQDTSSYKTPVVAC